MIHLNNLNINRKNKKKRCENKTFKIIFNLLNENPLKIPQ